MTHKILLFVPSNTQSLLESRFYEPGEAIITQGDAARTFYIVAEGTTEVTGTVTSPAEEELILEGDHELLSQTTNSNGTITYTVKYGTLVQGDYFGEQALMNDDKRGASVIATTSTRCLCLSKDIFRFAEIFRVLMLKGKALNLYCMNLVDEIAH